MKKRMLFAVLGALALATTAMAQRDARYLLGDWRGYGERLADTHAINPCWDVESVIGQRFHAELLIQVPGEIEPCMFECDGSVFIGDGLAAVGSDDDHYILLSGRTRAMGDGSVRVSGFNYLVLNQRFVPVDGGAFAVTQLAGGPNWESLGGADVSGRRSGRYISRNGGSTMFGDISNVGQNERGEPGPTTALEGMFRMDQLMIPGSREPMDVTFDVEGTITPPDPNRSPVFSMIAAPGGEAGEPAGIIAILIGLLRPEPAGPGTLVGQYRLYNNAFQLVNDIIRGTNTGFDQGAFELPAVQ